ncbi:NUDIX hydrolase [Kitasatospora sp. NPDC051853]|uniref:NUDIX hydrolase n=1 Tax=Kitasatospora sp. NPDC051853 TaxID=3364058 RepID=UPI0037B961C7
MELRRRRTSRVLLVDEAERLLLLCGRDPRRPGAGWWFTVGGGVEAGEDHLRAAVRELREETALDLPAERFGPVVWTRQAVFSLDGQGYDQYEEYRLLRVTAAEAARVRVDEGEATHGHRWWSLDELASTAETVRPVRLAVLLGDLLRTGPPELPLHLGDFNEDDDDRE